MPFPSSIRSGSRRSASCDSADPSVTIYPLNEYAIFNQIYTGTYPGWGTGINVTTESEVLTNPDYNDYLFWDGMHPTSKAHEVDGIAAYNLIVSQSVSPARSVAAAAIEAGAQSDLAAFGTNIGLGPSSQPLLLVQESNGTGASSGTVAATCTVSTSTSLQAIETHLATARRSIPKGVVGTTFATTVSATVLIPFRV